MGVDSAQKKPHEQEKSDASRSKQQKTDSHTQSRTSQKGSPANKSMWIYIVLFIVIVGFIAVLEIKAKWASLNANPVIQKEEGFSFKNAKNQFSDVFKEVPSLFDEFPSASLATTSPSSTQAEPISTSTENFIKQITNKLKNTETEK